MRLAWAGTFKLNCSRLLAKGSSSDAEAVRSSFDEGLGFYMGSAFAAVSM